MYSFGTIKTNTTFGGALNIVRNDKKLYHRMRSIEREYPLLSKYFLFKRYLKNLVLMSALHPVGNYNIRACKLFQLIKI
jgi:hypothetical protein